MANDPYGFTLGQPSKTLTAGNGGLGGAFYNTFGFDPTPGFNLGHTSTGVPSINATGTNNPPKVAFWVLLPLVPNPQPQTPAA